MGRIASNAVFGLYLSLYFLYVAAWSWHLTDAASALPGFTGFGWFFRYLTWWGFSLQVVQLLLVTASFWAAKSHPIHRLADDLSSALFGLANLITILFYYLKYSGTDVVEGGHVERPPWLNVLVHALNSVLAWTDLLIWGRKFTKRAERMCMGLAVGYLSFLLLVREVTGIYPYPFLNTIPWPWGFTGFVVGSLVIFFMLFHGGRRLSKVLSGGRSRSKPFILKRL